MASGFFFFFFFGISSVGLACLCGMQTVPLVDLHVQVQYLIAGQIGEGGQAIRTPLPFFLEKI